MCSRVVLAQKGDVQKVKNEFPFTKFFENAPQPMFKERSYEEDLDMAEGCFRHIRKIFTELDVSAQDAGRGYFFGLVMSTVFGYCVFTIYQVGCR